MAGVITLIVLQAVGRNTKSVGAGFTLLDSGVKRLTSPDLALLPAGAIAVKTGPKTAPGEEPGAVPGGSVGETSTLPRNPVVSV